MILLVFYTLLLGTFIRSSVFEWKWTEGPNLRDDCETTNPIPCARTNPGVVQLTSTKIAFFGGMGVNLGFYNDMFTYDVALSSWTYYSGGHQDEVDAVPYYGQEGVESKDNLPRWRRFTGMDRMSDTKLVMFGGTDSTQAGGAMYDIWIFDTQSTYWTWEGGWTNQEDPDWDSKLCDTQEVPGSRVGHQIFFLDGRKVVVIAGQSYNGWFLDDVYEYDIIDYCWAWRGGSRQYNFGHRQIGFGIFNPGNTPGGISNFAAWKKNSNELMIFGGEKINDKLWSAVWTYKRNTREWAWTGGTLEFDLQTECKMNNTYLPRSLCALSGRKNCGSVKINDDEVFITSGRRDEFLWEQDVFFYKISTGEFKWLGGSIPELPGEYGEKGNYSKKTWPGSREGIATALGNPNEILYFYGYGYDRTTNWGFLSDIFVYQYCETCGENAICHEGYCQCINEYSGDPLTKCHPICSTTCHKNATCTSPDICTCNIGYLGNGEICIPECLFPPCSFLAHEICVAPEKCDCVFGYSGNPCRPVCDNCGMNTVCIDPQICNCSLGFIGNPYENCTSNSYICSPQCKENATCTFTDTCTCKNGFSGDGVLCNPVCETPRPCHENATCIAPDTCVCNVGFSGIGNYNCEPFCTGGCGINAECIAPEICSCLNQYDGDEKIECFPICSSTCTQNATCVTPNNCSCNVGFDGDGINICTPICNPECPINASCVGPNNCVCGGQYFIGMNWQCQPICKGSFSCAMLYSKCIAPDICECIGESTGDPYENCEYVCGPTCGENAFCDESRTCVCRNGYTGDPMSQCTPSCTPNCGRNASCSAPNDCQCLPWFYPPEPNSAWVKCEPICNGSNICVENAVCVAPNVCECRDNYIGIGNEICEPDCTPKCHVKADCVSGDANLCICKTGFVGNGRECVSETPITLYIALGAAGGSVLFVLLVVITIIICAVICLSCFYVCRKKRSAKKTFELLEKKHGRQDQFYFVDQKEAEEVTANFKINSKLFRLKMKDLKVVKSIGSGGFAKVYLCTLNEQKVAFKCFDTKMLGKELSLISSLRHSSLPRFYGCCLQPPRCGYVIEYCANGNLNEYITKHSNEVSIDEKIRIFREVAIGMAYLTKNNVIHRDLKPENILLDEFKKAKIIDFGLSRLVERNQQTQKTRNVGTSLYMAPEVFLGEEYSSSCDVFSFGIMMWCVIAENFQPFGEKQFNIQIKMSTNPDLRPNIRELRLTPEKNYLKNIIKKCWDTVPRKRPTFQNLTKTLK